MSDIEEVNGIIYTANYESLKYVPDNTESIIINSKTKYIPDGKDTSYIFLKSVNTLTKIREDWFLLILQLYSVNSCRFFIMY